MNKLIISGRLVAQPELKTSSNNKEYCQFTVAVYRSKDNVDFIECMAFDKNAQVVSSLGTKGQYVYVEGNLQISTYQRKTDNVNVKSAKLLAEYIHVASVNPFGTSNQKTEEVEEQKQLFKSETKEYSFPFITEDDLPF